LAALAALASPDALTLAADTSLETAVRKRTLLPAATVRMCEPSSLLTQSSITACLGAEDEGALPIRLM